MTSLAHGEEPTLVKYKQEDMRDHFITCLEKKELCVFPSNKRKILRNEEKSETFQLYCTCRLPHVGDMICFDMCDEWHHLSCIDPVKNPKDNWYCTKCIPMEIH